MFGVILRQYIINGIIYPGFFITGGYQYGHLSGEITVNDFRAFQNGPSFDQVNQYQEIQAGK